jgi:hypothetical protein
MWLDNESIVRRGAPQLLNLHKILKIQALLMVVVVEFCSLVS